MRKFSARFFGGKAAAALALGVGMYLAGGGVASATNTDVTDADNTTAATAVFGNNDGITKTAPNSGATSNNTINIQLTNNSLGVACGSYFYAAGSVVNGNTVNIISGQVAGKSFQGFGDVGAVGGVSSTTNAMGNRVLISGGTVGGRIFGGWSLSGNAGGTGENEGNTVKIEGGTVTNSIVGGLAEENGGATGSADGNEITISGGTVDTESQIVGGNSLGGTATGNKVAISGGNVTAYSIYGAMAESTAESNTVEILGGTVTATDEAINGGYSSEGLAKSNEVIISGTANVTGDVYGGRALDGDAGADGAVNKVTVSDTAIVAGNVFGGFVNGTGNALYNEVNITGGTIGTAGTTAVYGGHTSYIDGDASNNTVSIKDATINSDVYGGSGGTASYNIVTIEKNTIGKSTTFTDGVGIHGGIAMNGAASHNAVNVLAPVTVAGIIGGESFSGGDTSGNTLNLGATGITVTQGTDTGYGVRGFNTIAITDAVAWEADATVLSAKEFDFAGGLIDITGATGLTGATGTGTMTLLASGTANNFTTLDLKYIKDGETQEYVGTDSVVVKESTEGGTETLTNKVILTTGGTKHTVSLDESSNYKNVLYKIEGDSSVTKVDLSNWDGATYNLGDTYTGTKVPVVTGSFAVPASTRNILNAPTENFFGEVTGDREYTSEAFKPITEKGVTLSGVKTGGVKVEDSGKTLKYYAETMGVQEVAMGAMTWDDGLAATTGYGFAGVTSIDASKLNFKFADTDKAALHKGSTMALVSDATGLTAGATVTGKPTQTVDYKVNGAALTGTLTGTVSTTAGAVNYQADSMTLDSVKLAGWDGTEGAVPTGWTANASGVGVDTDGMNMKTLPTATANILTTKTANYFTKDKITGENQYKETTSTEGDKDGAVTLTVTQTSGVTTNEDSSALVYEAGKTKQVTGLSLGTVAFAAGTTPLYTASDDAYAYKDVKVNTDDLAVTFADPLAATANDSMTLLAANKSLGTISSEVKSAYTTDEKATGVGGFTLTGEILGKVAKNDANEVAYTVDSNKASALTFGTMDWKDGATLLDHSTTLSNVSFVGAKVDTSAIKFSDLKELKDGEKTLVANYGGKPGDITGNTYSIGAGVKGKGSASYDASADALVFTATAGSAIPDDAVTHSVVMGTEVSLAALSTGNDFIGSAIDGLALSGNIGADGVSTFAQMGGGAMRQDTGSHVDTHTWNAILALGHKNEKEKSTTQYGAFFEYGTGNYTTDNDGQRGDGSMHYTGGGLLAKWTAKHGFYVEGSLRAGSVHDDARDVLRDAVQGYSYDTSAGYWGAHIGIGKEFVVSNGNTVDVYAKYFHNRRNSVSFDAGGNHYDLDAVTSSVIRVGTRYTMKRKSWNFYGGLAYEHELDGKAAGTVDGLGIRAADISGGSGRLEIGATMTPENSPWSLDLNVTGFAGKKQGVMGGVSATWNF